MDGSSLSQGAKVYFRINLFNGAVPIDITQTTVSLFVVTVIVVIIGILLGRNLTKKPGRRQALVEKIVLTLYNLVESTMGKHNLKYVPYVGTIFISSLFGTLIGLTKVFRSTTADMMVIMGWSLLTSFLCWYEGIRNKGFSIIDVASICPTYYGRKNKRGDAVEMMKWQRDHAVTVEQAAKMDPEQLKDKLVIGLLHHAQYPEFTYKYDMLIQKLAEEREANE